MHECLETLRGQLQGLIAALGSLPAQSFGPSQGNWTFPAITSQDLIEIAQEIVREIDEKGLDDLPSPIVQRVQQLVPNVAFIQGQTTPNVWANAQLAVPAIIFTLESVLRQIRPALKPEDATEIFEQHNRLRQQFRNLQAKIAGYENQLANLDFKLKRIDDASEAAIQIPEDLESLSQARAEIVKLRDSAERQSADIKKLKGDCSVIFEEMSVSRASAESVLKNCETAYAAATSVGLAAAFATRSRKLAWSVWVWVTGLMLSLGAGAAYGTFRLQTLMELFKDPALPMSIVVTNVAMSIFTISAPIWFAWLSTKQITQRFKLSEDYAYKASVAQAYEGFRRESARVDKNLEFKLLDSALSRLDELPLRLVEPETYGSPWHDLANSDAVRQALQTIPAFAEKVRLIALEMISAQATGKAARIASTGDKLPPKD